jgi:hypothetical protein
MSMICNLRRASPADAERLLKSPRHIRGFLYGDEQAQAVEQAFQKRGLLSRLLWRLFLHRRYAPAPPAIPWEARRRGDEIDIEKSWHGLHFLLTGKQEGGDAPACYLLHGGRRIGKVDVGYGPARALMPADARRFADFLQSLSADELRRRFDPDRMTELKLYPDIWDEGDEAFDYLYENFVSLRDFMIAAREARDAVIIYLN